MCQTKRAENLAGSGNCRCGCCGCGCGPFPRRFFSKSEEKEWIENYRDQLKSELAAVEEQINECKGG